ncbi:transporter [Geomonas sp.]|uniref:transporter n=1 Tax=Geomonas sp. TaxID=2651584 RepID=UPI002B45D8C9|nr:transporter [Geomonas sp.]HJV37100.1 transporter [Geomonas sp.]
MTVETGRLHRMEMVRTSDRLRRMSCLLAAFALSCPALAHAAGPLATVGVGFEFASGTYGTGHRTESVYVPLTAAYYPTDRLAFSLEIPFLYQSNSQVNTGLFTGAGSTAMHGMSMMGPGTLGSTSSSSSTAGSGGSAESGLGDMIAKAGYVLVPEGDYKPKIRPYLQVKFPTGDQNKALGTGTFSESIFVELSKQLGNWYSFAETGYTFQGSSSRIALKNYLSYDAGIGYGIADSFLPMVIVKGSGAPVAGSGDLLEVRLKLKYLATQSTGIEGYLAKGITTNSPDYGSGLAVFHDF